MMGQPRILGMPRPHYAVAASMDLDGLAGYVVVDDVAPHVENTAFSVSMWVRDDSGGGAGDRVLYAINTQAQANTLLVYRLGGSSNLVIFGSGTISYTRDKSTNIPAGAWHHIVLTWDVGGDGRVSVYVDGGRELRSNGAYNTAKQADDRHTIGAEWNPGAIDKLWSGPFAQVAIYDRTLTAAEVAALYALGRPTRERGAGALYRPGRNGSRLPAVVDESGVWHVNGTAVGVDASDCVVEIP